MKKITTFLRSTVFLSKTLASKALRRVVRIILFLIISSSFGSYTMAGLQEKQNIPKMVQRAELIIRGKVISTESQWKEDSRGRHIYTSVTVKILDKIKGNIKDDAFAFEIVGGTVDDIREVVSDTPAFEIDEDAIVFLAGQPLTIKQGINSKIPIYNGRVYRNDSEITADNFIQAIKILEQDPNASVSLGEKDQEPTVGVTAAECYVYSGYKWPGTSPTVSYKINENTSDCTGEGAAVQAAASSWNNVGANFTFNYGGSHTRTYPSQNYVNEIMWGTTVYEDSFGETTTWVLNNVTIVECDVVFNDPDFDWSTKPVPYSWEADVETVALHEFGHWLSLDDLYDDADEDNIMYGYGYTGEVKRIFQSCDCDGICYIYPKSGCGCVNPPVRLCPDCEPEDQNLGTIGTVPWYSVSGNCGNGGKWVGQFVGEAGATYHFDLCPDSPGSGTANFDADIKITNSSCGIITGQDGFCSSPQYLPNNYSWTCTTNGTYYVIIAPYNSYNSHTCGGDSSDTFTLKYYKETCSPPTPPTGVLATDGTYTDKVQVSWGDNGATSYEIWRYTSDNSGLASKIADDTASPYDDTNAVAGTTCWYWVKAKNSCGTSGFSNGDSGYLAVTPPIPPTDVSATDGTYTDRVQVSWVDNGATSYEIWRNTSDNSGLASKIADDTASPYDDTNAVAGTTYWYWVKAKNSGGTSGFSNGDSGYLTPPDAPVLHIEPNMTSGLCNMISWDAVLQAKDYYAECASDPCFLVVDYNSGWITKTSYQFCGLIGCQEYWYRVKSGLSAWSQTSQAEFQSDTLIDTTVTSGGDVILVESGTPLVDTVGGTNDSFDTDIDSYFNGFLVTTSTTLTQIEIYLGISTSRSIEFVVYEGGPSFSDQYNRIHSSTLDSSGTGTKFYTSDTISVPLEAGKHYMIGAVWNGSVTAYYDSIDSSPTFADYTGWGIYYGFPSPNILSEIYNDSPTTFYHRYTTAQAATYTSSGSVVSTPINLPAGGTWGIVDFNKTTPVDTALTVDVLPAVDSTPIPGYENVPSGADLGGISEPNIRLRANLSTDDPNSTPVFHDWSVTYTDPAGIESVWSNIESSIQVTPGDFEPDCDVDMDDLAVLAEQWLLEKLSADIAPGGGDGIVNFIDWAVFADGWQSVNDTNDLADFASQWLKLSAYCADIAPPPNGDGVVNFLDFAVLAEHWLEGI
jgi:hypothetical protein